MRNVRIACILTSRCNNYQIRVPSLDREACCREALELLEEAGARNVDIAVLSETFPCSVDGPSHDTLDGPLITSVRDAARRHNMYVIAPILEDATDGRCYNSAVVIGRDGKIIGVYHKYYPFWAEAGVTPGTEPPVFDLDFGRIGLAICFDAQFPDVWMKLGDQGAELVIWPSAYSGGRKLQAAAIYSNYYVVSCTIIPPDTTVVDIMGDILFRVQGAHQVIVHELDLDRTMVHDNYNGEKIAQMRRDLGDRVKMQYLYREGWWVIESTDPKLSVKQELKARGIETLQEYARRSRKEIDRMRNEGTSLPPETVEPGMPR